MERQLGVKAVVATLVGYVIGASIFILPAELAGSAGPAVVVSYLLAALIAAFACLASAQIGTVFPATGAGYVSVARMLSPLAGFTGIWMMLAAYIMAIVLIALGFAEYFIALVPAANKLMVTVGVIVFFAIANTCKIDVLMGIQGILVLLFMVALVAISAGGVVAMNPQNLTPFAPVGWHPVLLAAVPAFFSYGGFMAVMEMAGEIKDPARTIPRSLIISFALVVITYVALALALVGVVPWAELAALPAPVKAVAGELFGPVGAFVISLAILGAAATSINALILVASRDIVALGRDRLLPVFLAGGETGSKIPSVLVVTACSCLALAAGQKIVDYAVWVAVFNLLFQILIGWALLKIPAHAVDAYEGSPFKLGPTGLKVTGWGLICVSAFFLLLNLEDSAQHFWGVILYIIAGFSLYALGSRKNQPAA